MTDHALQDLRLTTTQQLPVYRIRAFSAYPQLSHAIFTRNGGVSRQPFHSLNLSHSVGDDPAAVERNFQIICDATGIASEKVVACHLVHGAEVLTVTRSNRQPMMGYADGLVTVEPGIFLYLRFGDCTPLFYFDPVRQAVGLTHAGWRGTMKNAAAATVQAMQKLGSDPANIIAVIGPSIGPCCYETGEEVMAAATQAFAVPDSLFKQNEKPGHAHFNMWEANRRQLAAAGVNQIISSGLCTACRTDQFFSHRAEKGKTGRFGVMLGLNGGAA
jgi:YfiH family protein